jgi:hypothetical protein
MTSSARSSVLPRRRLLVAVFVGLAIVAVNLGHGSLAVADVTPAAGTASSTRTLAAPASVPAGQKRSIDTAVNRVELATVTDDPGACALMTASEQRAVVQTAGVYAQIRTSSCARAVSATHAAFARAGVLARASRLDRHVAAALTAAPATISEHGRRAVIKATIAEKHFLGAQPTPISATVLQTGGVWKVAAIEQGTTI